MSTKPKARRVRSAYEFIKAHRQKYSVQVMCRRLGVARPATALGSHSRSQTGRMRTRDFFA